MTDYEEEQRNELEALESIYPEELTVISSTKTICFQIVVTSQEDAYNPDDMARCTLQFTYTPTYPDEAPLVEVESSENLNEDQENTLLDIMKEQIDENLGMVMVFTLVSVAQEKLHDLVEEEKTRRIEEEERRKREEEEAERKKFEGTRVNIETFLAWKEKFDAEIAEERRRKGLNITGPKKLTGKELFMKDHTLDDSDVKFLQEDGGETVKVDESLFQDLDDLDLDEELDDLDDS